MSPVKNWDLIGHLREGCGQDLSAQAGEVSGSAQVAGQQSLTHHDVVTQDVGKSLFVLVRQKTSDLLETEWSCNSITANQAPGDERDQCGMSQRYSKALTVQIDVYFIRLLYFALHYQLGIFPFGL